MYVCFRCSVRLKSCARCRPRPPARLRWLRAVARIARWTMLPNALRREGQGAAPQREWLAEHDHTRSCGQRGHRAPRRGACSHEGEVDSKPDNFLERRTPQGRRPSLLRSNVQGHVRRPIRAPFVGAHPQSRIWTLGVCHDL